ncbi:unnamed protein product [Phytophthora fragariaefolia]|uniref:Unnamed protein product n=1 Tax=Phytophthora fragariaefolia TaxID=1490495 RepID=A0A9W6TTE9_9STRA|nr:unnamed protein product [Phytophthora fragariaefolia]
MQARSEGEYRDRFEMPRMLRDVGYSEEMDDILGMTTRWVASALETQYKVAVANESIGRFTFTDNGATVTVRKDQEGTELAMPFVPKVFKEETRSTSGSLSDREKYSQAQQGFGRVSSELTQFSDDAFKSAMSHFDELWHNMHQGKITAITVVASAEETMETGEG